MSRQYYVADHQRRESCRYYSYMGSSFNHMCSYIDFTGHSRVYTDGERTVPKGYCDKYEKYKETKKRWTYNQSIKERSNV